MEEVACISRWISCCSLKMWSLLTGAASNLHVEVGIFMWFSSTVLSNTASFMHVKVGVLLWISSIVFANAGSCMRVKLGVLMLIPRGILCSLMTMVNIHVNADILLWIKSEYCVANADSLHACAAACPYR